MTTTAIAGPSVPLSFSLSPGSSTTQNGTLVDDGDSALQSISLATVATTSSILDTDPTNGVQMQVDDCSVAWAADGTCSGAQRTVLASGPVPAGDAFTSQSSGLSLTFTAVQRDGAPR